MIKKLKYNICCVLSNLLLPKGLYCFNYHRVGEPSLTKYDPNVFSCDEINFVEQIKYIKQNFKVISLADVPNVISKDLHSHKYALITFDDGYIDNYTCAFPILKKHHMPATFFLATNFVSNFEIPWWDKIAYLIKNTKKNIIQLDGWRESIRIDTNDLSNTIREVLCAVKSNYKNSIDDVVIELEKLTNVNVPEDNTLFMSWDNTREMKLSGMDFGSQTCSHRILSHLPCEEQEKEAKNSKNILEKEIESSIVSFAYPVGGLDSFTSKTESIIAKYYDFAFSFVSGIHTSKNLNRYALKRISIDNNCTVSQLILRLMKISIKNKKSKI